MKERIAIRAKFIVVNLELQMGKYNLTLRFHLTNIRSVRDNPQNPKLW